MKAFGVSALLTLALLAVIGCGGGDSTTVTVTHESAAQRAGIGLHKEAMLEEADRLEKRAEQRLIEAETAEKEGRTAESEALTHAGNELIKREGEIVEEVEALNQQEEP